MIKLIQFTLLTALRSINMSRFTFSNDQYEMAIGVDHITSVFIMIYDKRIEDEDEQLILQINNLGVDAKDNVTVFNKVQLVVIEEVRQAFEIARKLGNPYPTLDKERVYAIAKAFQIPVELRILYEILD